MSTRIKLIYLITFTSDLICNQVKVKIFDFIRLESYNATEACYDLEFGLGPILEQELHLMDYGNKYC